MSTLSIHGEAPWTSDVNALPTPGTRECSLVTSGGIAARKTSVAISGTGAQTVNLFKFTSGIRILEISGKITAVGDATTFSGVKFALYDGTNTVDITAAVDASGTIVGSKLLKTAALATALTHDKADQCRIVESVFNKPFVESFINAKAGVDNYIQLLFTGDESTDITADFCCKYAPIYDDSTLEAV